jgi:hypothetical protein
MIQARQLIQNSLTQPGVPPTVSEVETMMIEFAKIHVEAALKAASDGFRINLFEPNTDEVKKRILKSYPESNIK